MFNIIFKTENLFDNRLSPNKLVKFGKDKEYVFCDDSVVCGGFSKTNVFIGENNSGKSRFLRCLFSTNYYIMSYENFEDFYKDISSKISQLKIPFASPLKTFNDINQSIESKDRYSDDVRRYFESLKENSKFSRYIERYYFPVLRGIFI